MAKNIRVHAKQTSEYELIVATQIITTQFDLRLNSFDRILSEDHCKNTWIVKSIAAILDVIENIPILKCLNLNWQLKSIQRDSKCS